jgi:hypothetical protein
VEKLSLLNAAVSMDLMGLVALPKAAVTMSMCSQTLMELPGTMAGIMAPFRISSQRVDAFPFIVYHMLADLETLD